MATCPEANLIFAKRETPEMLSDWSFSIFEADRDTLMRYSWNIFDEGQYLEKFKISNEKYLKFLWEAKWYYDKRKNPFHNFAHGFAVMQAVYHLLHLTSLGKTLDTLQKFTLLLSGLCHDVNHTGKNNAFEAATWSKLALTYNDRWVSH